MLIQYKKDYEKIAMGLLSYLPDFKNIENLKRLIRMKMTLFCIFIVIVKIIWWA